MTCFSSEGSELGSMRFQGEGRVAAVQTTIQPETRQLESTTQTAQEKEAMPMKKLNTILSLIATALAFVVALTRDQVRPSLPLTIPE